MTLRSAKARAKKKDLPFDIDSEYLMSLFPSDGLCPALGTPMIWGGDLASSPALDRAIPDLGYVRGNVTFISGLANRIKTDATTEQVLRVAQYLKDKEHSS